MPSSVSQSVSVPAVRARLRTAVSGYQAYGEVPMKIVVSVHELATETQLIIDNMRRSNAPVLIGDPNRPAAVLIALEEYDRLLREAQKASAAAAAAASAPVLDTTQPLPSSQPV